MAIMKFGHAVVGAIYSASPSNAAEVVSVFAALEPAGHGTWSVQSESGGVLTLRRTFDGGTTYETMGTVSNGKWAIRDQVSWQLDRTDAQASWIYSKVTEEATDLAGTQEFKDAVAANLRGVVAVRAVTIPAAVSLAPGTRTVVVTWPRTMPSSSYDVDIAPDVVLLSGPYTYSITSKTTTGCVLNYSNASLVVSLAAGSVDLFAVRT